MIIKTKLTPIALIAIVLIFACIFVPTTSPRSNNYLTSATVYNCGVGADQVQTSINFDCHGNGCPKHQTGKTCRTISPIADILFSVIRFLSVGVGLVIVASMVYAGVQYIGSRGEPQATEAAINRIRSNIIALVLFIFAYAILAYIIPPGYLL